MPIIIVTHCSGSLRFRYTPSEFGGGTPRYAADFMTSSNLLRYKRLRRSNEDDLSFGKPAINFQKDVD